MGSKKIIKIDCCDNGSHVIERQGGGFRCHMCNTIFDSSGGVVGERNPRRSTPTGLNLKGVAKMFSK